MENSQQSSLFGLTIDPLAKAQLSEAARWARFLAITGFIMLGLSLIFLIIMSFFIINSLNKMSGAGFVDDGTSGMYDVVIIFWILFYLAGMIIALFPFLFLFRFSKKLKLALASDDQEQLNISFTTLKALFRFVGILSIIGIVIMAFVFFSFMLSFVMTGGYGI